MSSHHKNDEEDSESFISDTTTLRSTESVLSVDSLNSGDAKKGPDTKKIKLGINGEDNASTDTLRPEITDPYLRRLSWLGLEVSRLSEQQRWIQDDLKKYLDFEETEDQWRKTLRKVQKMPGKLRDYYNDVPKERALSFGSHLQPDDAIEAVLLRSHGINTWYITVSPEMKSVLRSRFIYNLGKAEEDEESLAGPAPRPVPAWDRRFVDSTSMLAAVRVTSKNIFNLNLALEASTLGQIHGWKNCISNFLGDERQEAYQTWLQMMGAWNIYRAGADAEEAEIAKAKATYLWDTVRSKLPVMGAYEDRIKTSQEQMERIIDHTGTYQDFPDQWDWVLAQDRVLRSVNGPTLYERSEDVGINAHSHLTTLGYIDHS